MNLWNKKPKEEVVAVVDKEHEYKVAIQNLITFLSVRETKFADATHRIILIDGQITELYKNIFFFKDQLKNLSGGSSSVTLAKNNVINLSRQFKPELWREFTIFALDSITSILPVFTSTVKLMREQAGNAENVARVARSFATKIQDHLNMGLHSMNMVSLRSFNDQVAEFDERILVLQVTAINMDADITDMKTIFDILRSVNTKARHALQTSVLQSLQFILNNVNLLEEYTNAIAVILQSKVMEEAPLLKPEIFDAVKPLDSELEKLENEVL